MSTMEKSIVTSLGPVSVTPFVEAGTVSTGVTKVALPASNNGGVVRRLKIVNGHASQLLAWTVVPKGASAPTITAAYGANCGVIILPSQNEYINISWAQDLYIVGSAASTSYCVSCFTE